MSFLTSLFTGGDSIKAIGETVDKLFTSDEERLAQKLELVKAENDLKTKILELDTSLALGQIEINKIEATSQELFVSGWRPFIGWICGFALCYAFILEPFLRFAANVVFGYVGSFPIIDLGELWPILLGMLGLGGLRTYEKVKGV